jgi:hypothetical protein
MGCQLGTTGVPTFTISWLTTESYTSKPLAGLAMALMEVKLILGISNPLLVAVMSNTAEASGVKVPIPIPCENEAYEARNIKYRTSNLFFINRTCFE